MRYLIPIVMLAFFAVETKADTYISNDGRHPVPTSGFVITPHTVAVGASVTGSIPAGSKGFVFIAISGTVTLGGATIPVGTTISTNNILGSALAYTTAGGSSAFVYYE